MKNIGMSIISGCIVISLSGCGGEVASNELPSFGTESTMTVSYGMYGENNDLGSPEQIRIVWHKNNSIESKLTLTSDIDTRLDGYLSSKYGAPHYHYDIDQASETGIYKITCNIGVRSGEWAEYSCLRDGTFIIDQDNSIDNGFVVDYTGTNRVFSSDPTNTGTETVGFIGYPQQ